MVSRGALIPINNCRASHVWVLPRDTSCKADSVSMLNMFQVKAYIHVCACINYRHKLATELCRFICHNNNTYSCNMKFKFKTLALTGTSRQSYCVSYPHFTADQSNWQIEQYVCECVGNTQRSTIFK